MNDLSLSITTHTAPTNEKILPRIKKVVENCTEILLLDALKKDESNENSVIKIVIITRTFP